MALLRVSNGAHGQTLLWAKSARVVLGDRKFDVDAENGDAALYRARNNRFAGPGFPKPLPNLATN